MDAPFFLKGVAGRRLKPLSQVFIAAELLDILTTFAGLALYPQMWESNPLPGLLGGMFPAMLVKLCVVLGVVFVLEKVETWPRLVWIVPAMALSPVLWNVFSITAEFLQAAPPFLAAFSSAGGVP
jgi:uncharacterized membrane protein